MESLSLKEENVTKKRNLLSFQTKKEQKYTVIKDMRNFFRLNEQIKERIGTLRDTKNLFEHEEKH